MIKCWDLWKRKKWKEGIWKKQSRLEWHMQSVRLIISHILLSFFTSSRCQMYISVASLHFIFLSSHRHEHEQHENKSNNFSSSAIIIITANKILQFIRIIYSQIHKHHKQNIILICLNHIYISTFSLSLIFLYMSVIDVLQSFIAII